MCSYKGTDTDMQSSESSPSKNWYSIFYNIIHKLKNLCIGIKSYNYNGDSDSGDIKESSCYNVTYISH